MKKTIQSIIGMVLLVTMSVGYAHADSTPVPAVSGVTATSATLSVAPADLDILNREGTAVATFFEYSEPDQVCIMIYPTPENCKPKQTVPGVLNTTITNLKPNTRYSVVLKHDNTIRCITTPCPSNEFRSEPVVFTTQADTSTAPVFTRNLSYGARGTDVSALQAVLHAKGYLSVVPTGYYGPLTRAAVRLYQTNDMHITSTGTVGPLTRASLNSSLSITEEKFTGKITAVSTQCFVDGECSVSVDGKKVVTTIGWRQGAVGAIKGTVTDIGSLEHKIGVQVNVYAQKTADGYTLYGNNNYYIEVL